MATRRVFTILSAGACLILAAYLYTRTDEKPKFDTNFEGIKFYPADAPASPDSEWLAHAKNNLLSREPAPTPEDAMAYFDFVQSYSSALLSQFKENSD